MEHNSQGSSVRQNVSRDYFYHLLTRKILFTIIIVSFTPMIMVTSIILYRFQMSSREKVHAHLEELVQKHKQNIDNFLKERLSNIRIMVGRFSFEELSDQSFLQERLTLLQKEYDYVFVDLGVINSQGLQVAYAGPFKLGKALYSKADWFQKAMNRAYYKSDVFLGLRGLPHFIIAVKGNWKGEDWILRATIDFVAFNNLVENIRIGKTGFAFILNKEGEFQTKPRINITPCKDPYMDLMKNGSSAEYGVRIVEKKDECENKNIYAAAFLKHGEWMLVYQQRYSDAYSDFQKALNLAGLLLLLGGIGIITMAFILSKRMVRYISKIDVQKEIMNEQIVETGKLASVGELAAGIAHEINNPVAIMVEEAGWIEDLLEEEDFKEGENLDEFTRALKQINIQGKRCKEITHKLLSFARKTDSTIKEIQINDLIEEIVALSAQRGKYNNISIQTNLKDDLPRVKLSQSELQQVLLNLINNAIDAMAKAGGNIDITSSSEKDQLFIEVADDGPGIPKANLARIFDPFFTTKPVGKGTGLGLSICYGIITKMGGDIEVRSIVDGGTTFRIKIPIRTGEDIESENRKKD